MPSISDVAEKAGVSTATVSRTFRSPNLLNTQTHERVMEAARSLNYQPRRSSASVEKEAARRSSVRAADAIGFQFFSAEAHDTLFSNSFYGRILAGAQAEASRHGFHLLVHTTNRHALLKQMPRMVEEKTIGGMLLVGTADPDVLAAFTGHIPHLVLVDNRDTTGNHESVISDGFGGAYAATRHLLDLGHTNLGFVCNDPGVTTFTDRIRGFLCAQMEAGICPPIDAVFGQSTTDADLENAIADRLLRPDRPTALVAANDNHAFRVLDVCRKLLFSVPGDLSIVGFDDIPFSRHLTPALSTVTVDTYFMGVLAVRHLLARIAYGEEAGEINEESRRIHPPVCSMVPVSFAARQSSGPLPVTPKK